MAEYVGVDLLSHEVFVLFLVKLLLFHDPLELLVMLTCLFMI